MPFDIPKFLEREFGSVEKALTLLHRYGYDVEKMTVYQWFRRDSIPTRWALTLIALRESETGRPVSLTAYLR